MAFGKRWTQTLYDLSTREDKEDLLLQYDSACMGDRVEALIPCLLPSLTKDQQRDVSLMRQRYLDQDRKITWMKALPLKEEEDTYLDEVNELTEAFPRFCDFVPVEAVMRQLVLRAAQLKDPAVLWQGFVEIIREDGSSAY